MRTGRRIKEITDYAKSIGLNTKIMSRGTSCQAGGDIILFTDGFDWQNEKVSVSHLKNIGDDRAVYDESGRPYDLWIFKSPKDGEKTWECVSMEAFYNAPEDKRFIIGSDGKSGDGGIYFVENECNHFSDLVTEMFDGGTDAKNASLDLQKQKPECNENGWCDVPLPEGAFIAGTLHLNREQAKTLANQLMYFADHGELPQEKMERSEQRTINLLMNVYVASAFYLQLRRFHEISTLNWRSIMKYACRVANILREKGYGVTIQCGREEKDAFLDENECRYRSCHDSISYVGHYDELEKYVYGVIPFDFLDAFLGKESENELFS